jgi:hypothetical protein
MLLIRQSQLEPLARPLREKFESELCDLFANAYPRECRQAGGRPALLRWTKAGVAASISAGYTSQHACGRWLLLMMMMGVDFAVDPQLPWMQTCLDSARSRTPVERIDEAFDEAMHWLGMTAGEKAERVVRAMIRIRNFDFASVPPLQGQAEIDDACERLHALYPEKFLSQGPQLTAECVASQLATAAEYGLTVPAGRFLFVLLSFMLGSGFYRDPLHPWAGEALDPENEAASSERAALLEAAARAHMAVSLEGA